MDFQMITDRLKENMTVMVLTTEMKELGKGGQGHESNNNLV